MGSGGGGGSETLQACAHTFGMIRNSFQELKRHNNTIEYIFSNDTTTCEYMQYLFVLDI